MQDRRPRFSIANTNEAAPRREKIERDSETGPASQRLMNMLSELNERLGQDEAEREKLWREIDTTRQSLMNLEDKSDQAEKIFLTLENKITRSTNMKNLEKWRRLIEENQRALYAQIKKVEAGHQSLEGRVDNTETLAGSAHIKIDQVNKGQEKLSRRIETVNDDRVVLLKKMEGLEETIRQTQDTLRAKALVMLTDQGLANNQVKSEPVIVGEPDVVKPEAGDPWAMDMDMLGEFDDRHPVKVDRERQITRNYFYATSAAVLLALLGTGLWFAKDKVNLNFNVPQFEIATPTFLNSDTETVTANTELTTDQLREEDLAAVEIVTTTEPATETVQANATENITTVSAPKILDFAAEEQKAVEAFLARAPESPITDRIEADGSLPPIVKEIESKAFSGSGEAQHDLAAIYTAGHGGVKGSYEKAAMWFNEASYKDIPNARYNLGVLYQQGLGVKKDEARAVELYKAASALGHPEAQYNLGISYIEGVGTEHNIAHAAYYFERAALNGINEAAYNLGLVYENGLTGAPQPDEALYWYKKSADQGNPEAIQALANLSRQMGLSSQDVNNLVSRLEVLRPALAKAASQTPATSQETPVTTEVEVTTPQTNEVQSETQPVVETKTTNETKAAVEEKVETSSTFSPGSQAVIIAQIQEQLMRMGMYPGPADGIPGPLTEDAVIAYQKQKGLEANGLVSEDLLVHMLAEEFELNGTSQLGAR